MQDLNVSLARRFLRMAINSMVVFLLFFMVLSCQKIKQDIPIVDGKVTNADVNNWILDSMRYYYYWNNSIPSNVAIIKDVDPETFFDALLNKPLDRFSWIQNNQELRNELSGKIMTSGLGLGFFLIGDEGYAGAAVRFVHKGSPAALAGVKRGDVFVKINGEPFKVSGTSVINADPIFGNKPFTLTKGTFFKDKIETGEEVLLTPVEGFQESAIHLDTVLTTPNGTKVGYLFYNRFLANQAQELIDAFGRFKAAGVTELIIDERYNSGGSVSVAALLAALIHKNFSINTSFIRYLFNSNFSTEEYNYGQLFGRGNAQIVASNNLNLERVFILATYSSASASELLINNLRPLMGESNVIHIGKVTRGKDEASITISNSSPVFRGEHDWGIQPIVLKYTNRDGVGGFVDGLVPQYEVTETIPYEAMGSLTDPLIGKSLSLIDPVLMNSLSKQMGIAIERQHQYQIDEFDQFNRKIVAPGMLDITDSKRGIGLKLD